MAAPEWRFWLDSTDQEIETALSVIGTPVALIEVLPDGYEIVAGNEPMSFVYGVSQDRARQLWRKKIHRLVDRIEDERFVAYLRRSLSHYDQCVNANSEIEIETSYLQQDGDLNWFSNIMTPVFKGSLIKRILVTVTDVSYKYQRALSPNGGRLSVCGWCHSKVREGTDDWISIEHHLIEKHNYQISHGICETCMTTVQAGPDDQQVILDPRMSYRIEDQTGIVHAIVKDKVDYEVSKAFWDDLARNQKYDHYDVIYDHTKTTATLSNDEVKRLVEYTSRYKDQLAGTRMAVVVADNVDYSLAQLADDLPGGPGIEVKPFWKYSEARSWVRQSV